MSHIANIPRNNLLVNKKAYLLFKKKDIAVEKVYLECLKKTAAVIFVHQFPLSLSLQDNYRNIPEER